MSFTLRSQAISSKFIERRNSLPMRVLLILSFSIATALAAQIEIPVPGTIVPMTLQTAIVLLAGLKLGWRDGLLSQALYIAGGAIGLPFFAGAAGLGVLLGPTGGYLAGFVLAAALAGALSRYATTFVRTWLVAFIAALPIFIAGVAVLKAFMLCSWSEALIMGVTPFILGDLAKVTLVACAHRVVRFRSL